MSYDIGPKIGIEGEKEFRAAIMSINTRIKTLGTEMKAVTSAYDKNDASVGKLTQQQSVLTQQINAQIKKLNLMHDGLDKSREKYGENSDQTLKWQQQVNRATEQLNRLEQSLTENQGALDEASRRTGGLADAEAEAARRAAELERAQQAAADSVAAMSTKLAGATQAMDGVNRAALAAAGAAAALGGAAAVVGMNFEAQMSKVESISVASADEMEALAAKAQEMGATTQFTATQAGEALEYMAMAGWKSQQMMDGLPGIMNLAAASGEDLGTVSDIVTDALTAFGLQASDSAHFADVLAKAASSSNTDITMMGETFKYAAPMAGALGYSVEDTAVAIGLMANAGIKGEMAGTALRGVLTNLSKPSDQVAGYMKKLGLSLTDNAGEVKPLNVLLGEMRQKFSKLTDAQKAEYAAGIAGKNALSGMLALVNSSDKDFNAMTKAIEQSSGTAKRMAKTMNDNLKGSLTLLGSAAEGAGIAFYEKFAEPASDAVLALADKVGKFTQDLQSGKLDNAIRIIGAAAATAATGIVAMNAVLVAKDIANFTAAASVGGDVLRSYAAATKAGAVAQGALNLVQSLSPMGALAIAAAAVTTGFALYANMAGIAETETEKMSKRVDKLTESAEQYKQEQSDLNTARDEMLSGSLAELNHVQRLTDELEKLTDGTGQVNKKDLDRARILTDMINDILPGAVEWIEEQGNAYVTTADKLDALIKKETLKAWLDANAEGYQAAIQNQDELVRKTRESAEVIEDIQEKIIKTKQDMEQAAGTNPMKWEMLNTDLETYNAQLAENQLALESHKNQFLDNCIKIQEYESNKEAVISGDEEKIRESVEHTTLDLKKFTGNNLAELKQQEKDTRENYEQQLEWADQYPEVITQAILDEARSRADEAKTIAERAGKEETAAYAASLADGHTNVQQAVQTVTEVVRSALDTAQINAKQSGGYLAQGFANGIWENAREATQAATDMAQKAVEAIRTTIREGSPSRVTMQSGKWFDAGFEKGIADNAPLVAKTAAEMSEKVLQAANEWVSEQKFYNRLALGEEVEFWEKMKDVAGLNAKELAEIDKKKHTARADASKAALNESKQWIDTEKYYHRMSADEEVAAWQRVANRKNLLMSEQLEAEKSLFSAQQTLVDEHKKTLDEYDQSLTARMQSLEGYARIFDKIDTESTVSGKELLTNLKDQVQAFQDWQMDLQALSDKGVAGGLFEKLREMGPAAAKEIHALSTLTSDELQEYADMFAEKTALIEQQARAEIPPIEIPVELKSGTLMHGMANATPTVVTVTAGLIAAFQKTVAGKATEVQQSGAQSMEALARGMQENAIALEREAANNMEQSIQRIKSFESSFQDAGNALMKGVAQGISAGRSGVINAIVWALRAAVSAANEEMQINSPSKVWAGIGGYMAQGLGVGFVEQMRSVAREITESIPIPSAETPRHLMERIGEATVNGVAAAMGGSSQMIRFEAPLILDGKEVTRVVLDHMPQIARQRG